MNVHDTLVAARAVIDTPEKWTTHCLARDAEGSPCPVEDERSVCFCAAGAIRKASGEIAD